MHFPRYWAKGTHEQPGPEGKPVRFACWRSSDESVEDARARAMAAARKLVEAFLRGAPRPDPYAYGDQPLREPVLEVVTGTDDGPEAVLTRNARGCLVLNTARVMFVDVDYYGREPAPLLRAIGLRGQRGKQEQATLARATEWLEARPRWAWRVYRTRAGLRLMATHAPVEVTSQTTLGAFRALEADPLYRKLCDVQESFRARLTPKPERLKPPMEFPPTWPFETPEAEAEFETWQREYEAQSAGWATAELVTTLGSGEVHPEVQPIVDCHDRVARVGSGLPLA